MAKGKRLTEQQIEEIVQEYSVKKRVAEVAKSLGLSKTAVTSHLQELGIFSKANRSVTLSVEQMTEITNRYQKGESANKIAEILELKSSVVVKLLKNTGILRKKNNLGYYKSLTPERIQKLTQMYQQGLSSSKIAAEFNVSNDLVLKYLRLEGITVKTSASYSRCLLTPEQITEICRRYKEGQGICELAALYNTTTTTLKKIFTTRGVTVCRKRGLNISRQKLSFEQQQEVIKLCEKGEILFDIAQRFGVSEHTIRRIIKSHSVLREKPIAGLKPNQVSEICQLYQQNLCIYKIAKLYNVSHNSIKKLLSNKGVLEKNATKES